MTTIDSSERFAALPDEETLAGTVTGLEARGFSVEVVDDLEAARTAVLAHIAKGSSVMTNTPHFAPGSGHAITRDGMLVVASALGSQLASYAWGAAQVILVVGAQKLVPDLEAAHERIFAYSLKLENARAFQVYGQNSRVRKILQIHHEDPGRIHIVLVRQRIGF